MPLRATYLDNNQIAKLTLMGYDKARPRIEDIVMAVAIFEGCPLFQSRFRFI
jgi:hypothetical protein